MGVVGGDLEVAGLVGGRVVYPSTTRAGTRASLSMTPMAAAYCWQ